VADLGPENSDGDTQWKVDMSGMGKEATRKA
jgi:hypothetical protein